MLTTFKCGTVNAFNRVPLLTIMTILFVEIVIFEIFLSSGKQLKNHIIQYTVKFVAFVLTISNLVQYETCENLNRDVRSYILLVFNTWYTFLIHLKGESKKRRISFILDN